MSASFEAAFARVVGVEGGFGNDPADRGNWTTGVIGQGVCAGTKYGISAMAYPTLDIKNLTLEAAHNIYELQYWAPVSGDSLPPTIAMIVFDGAVNSGPAQSVKWLQIALGLAPDGRVGPLTLAAAAKADPRALAVYVLVERALFMASLGTFPKYGRGWFRRLFKLAEGA